MTIRFGLCLLPLLLAAACSSTDTAALVPPSSQSDDFAMLPDAAPLPASRDKADSSDDGALVEAASYAPGASRRVEGGSSELNALIAQYARHYEVPESLVRRVVKRESNFRPEARNGPYWGLMQILPATARGMGFEGPPSALLDAETNLKYAVKYLRGAYLVAGGDHDQSVRLYARGYYYDAKRKGLLEETGLRKPRKKPAEAAELVLASASPPIATSAGAAQWQQGSATTAPELPAVAGTGPAQPQPTSKEARPAVLSASSSGKAARVAASPSASER